MSVNVFLAGYWLTQVFLDNTPIYTHLFNGPFFRDYPGEPVPER